MGMGRHNGAAVTEWFLKTAGTSYRTIIDGRELVLHSAALDRRVIFPGNIRQSLAPGFGFAEQLHIARRHLLATVCNYIALDPAWMSRSMHLSLGAGLGGVMAHRSRGLTRWMGKMPGLGQTRTRIVAKAFADAGDRFARVEISTGNQALATAAALAGKVINVTDLMTLKEAVDNLGAVLPGTAATLPAAGQLRDANCAMCRRVPRSAGA